MKQSVKRKTLTGNWEKFGFEYKSKRFFVKNYTSGDIFVSFENNDEENESYKIKSGMGEEVAITWSSLQFQPNVVDAIYVKGTGEVEVQQIDFQ